MFACRSDVKVRSNLYPWIAALSFGFLLASLLLPPPAIGATATKAGTRAGADSAGAGSRDEGISVRVIEDGKQTTAKRSRSTHEGTKLDAASDEYGAEAPEPPEPPEPPGSHENDLVRFGQDIEIPSGKVIDGSVVAIGGSVTVYGRVKGDCVAVGGSVSIRGNGAVEGDAVSVGGATSASDSASVGGSNVSVGAWPFKGGHGGGLIPLLGLMGLGALAGVFTTIVQLLLTVFFAWLCLLLARERMEHAVDQMGHQFGKSFLWGLLGWVAMIVSVPSIAVVCAIAMVILVITIIGIPVAILLAIVMVFALIAAVLGIIVATFLGYVNGSMYLGRVLLSRRNPGVRAAPLRAIIIGALLILGLKVVGNILGLIGVVFVMPISFAFGIAAVVLGLVFTTAGLGSMILTRFSKGPVTGPGVAQPAAPGAGWYAPPPPPSPVPPPAGGTSDAP